MIWVFKAYSYLWWVWNTGRVFTLNASFVKLFYEKIRNLALQRLVINLYRHLSRLRCNIWSNAQLFIDLVKLQRKVFSWYIHWNNFLIHNQNMLFRVCLRKSKTVSLDKSHDLRDQSIFRDGKNVAAHDGFQISRD